MVARHLGRGASYLFAAGSAVLIAGLGAGIALLGFGPLSIDFLADDMAGALERELPGYQVAIGSAELAWEGQRRGVAVRLRDVRFDGVDGAATLAVPALAVALDRGALLAGELRPTQVAVDGASIAIGRDAAGGLSWRSGGGDGGNWQALLDQMITGETGLRGVDIRDATVTLADARTGGHAEVRRAELSLRREDSGVRAQLTGAAVLNGREIPVEIGTLYRPAGAFNVAMRFRDLRPSDAAVGLAVSQLAVLAGVDVPLAGELNLAVDENGVAERLRFDLTAGAGTIDMAPLPVPAVLAKANASGTVELADGRLDIVALAAELADGLVLDATGEVTLTEVGLGAGLVAHLQGMTTASLANYWPEHVAEGARRWVTANISAGEITQAELRVQAEPGELQAPSPRPELIQLDFAFQGVAARYWQPLPPITDGRGTATLDLDSFQLRLERGRAGKLSVSDGKVDIVNLDKPTNHLATVEFVAKGSAAEALALLDRKPLGFASQLDLKPADVGGNASVWATFALPLRNDLALDDIGYQASAVLDGFAVPSLFGRYPLDNGELSLTVDDGGISAEGTAAVAGLPVSLSWRRDFGLTSRDGQPVYPDRYGIAGTASIAAFQAIGLDLTALGNGPAATRLNLWISDKGAMVATGEADLAAADLSSPMLRWRKPPGAPADVRFRLAADEQGLLRLNDLVFAAGDDLVLADADFGPGASLRKLYLPTLRLGGQDLAATVSWPGNGGPVDVALGGRLLDARPFLDGEGQDTERGTLAASVRLAVERLQVADKTMLAGVDGALSIADGDLSGGELTGRLNGIAPVHLTLRAGEDHRDVLLTSADAGAVLRALEVFEDADGGTLKVRGRVPHDGSPTTGRLTAVGVEVRKAPLLAQILSLGSISGIQDILDGGGMMLREVDLPFTLTAAELKVEEGHAVGPDIGLTVSGGFDRQSETMDFGGVLVPTYTLNRLIGGIPVIGDILVGRKGEGVFAVSYRVTGPADDPSVSVNPLTALAPGIFRSLIQALTPGGAAAGSDAPAAERERPNFR